MSFNFSQTAGTSGETSIVISATSTTDLEDRIDNYTIANNSGNSVVMSIMQKAYVPTEKYINLYPSSITWDGSGGTASLQIQSNDDWVITSNSWIELSRFGELDKGLPHNTMSGNGNTIIGIRALENTGTTRSGGITGHCISNSAISATTTVVQNAYIKPYIQLSYYSINCDSTGTTSSFTITSNVDWYIFVDESWASVNTESGSGNANITFTVNENTSSIARSCYITVYARNYDIKVSLAINQDATQLKPYITLSPDSFAVSDKGSTGNTINVSANCSYDITTETDWITLHSSSGSGDGTVIFDTDPAPLVKFNTGLIEFSNSAISRTVTVERQGEEPYLSASTSTVSFNLQSATSLVSVYSNVSWDVIVDIEDENKPWLTVSPSSGSGNGTISVNASSATTERACAIAVYNKEYGLFWGIKVKQIDGKRIYYKSYRQNVPIDTYTIFGDANLVSNTYDARNDIYVLLFDKDVTFIPTGAFRAGGYYGDFKEIILPETIETIEQRVFMSLTGLLTVTLPDSISSIGNQAFSGCTSLDRIALPNTITSTSTGMFYGCTSLESVILPKTIGTIGITSFYGCSGLKNVYSYNTTAPTLSNASFEGVANACVIHYPNGADYSEWKENRYLSGCTFIADL